MFQMSEDGRNWNEVSEERTRMVLSNTYEDVDIVIKDMKGIYSGKFYRTAVGTLYRWVEKETS